MKNKLKKSLLFCICVVAVLSVNAENVSGDLERIKRNYRSILIDSSANADSLLSDLIRIEPEKEMSDQMVVELHQRYPYDLEKIASYLSAMNEDGSWKDINYADTKRSGWEPKKHTERIQEMAKLYYTEGTPYYRSEALKASIHRALDYWFTAGLVCRNWWYNQIGIPKTLGTAFVLLEEQLSPEEKEAAIKVMNNSKFGMTGQNKIWLAGNVMIRALLENDGNLVRAARDTIASEIVLGQKEGIKNDWSFHQHGPQQQFGNYGLAFVSGMSFFARLFKGTAYEFGQEQMNILTSLIDKGYKWIIWNRYMDVSSLGRQFFHNAQLHKAYSLAFSAADLGVSGFPKTGNPLVGHKHFDDSDYTVHRSKSWMGTLKMSSNRVIGTELVNEDNLKGYYLGDGATYYYIDGDEYHNVFPLWDWRKIPGVTAYEDDAPLPNANKTKAHNRTDNVGGLNIGNVGMSAMELNREGLKGAKAWLFTEDYVVCLGAGIGSDSALCITTSVDQRLKKGELQVYDKRHWRAVNGKEMFNQKELRFFHDRMGYVLTGNDSCVAEAGKRSGQWHDFMKMYRPATVEGEVMSLHWVHGVRPKSAAYQYIVLPDVTPEKVERFKTKNVRVLYNEASVQAVSAVPGCYWVAVYQPQQIKIDGKTFQAPHAGIYCLTVEKGTLKVSGSHQFRKTEE